MTAQGDKSGSAANGAAEIQPVPISWEALEDAFENNAPEVHSYLHIVTGEVIRVVDGIADPSMHARIASDASYQRIDPVSSREQYRWMERFIATVEENEFREKLVQAIDGKGAFRRFKDVLMAYPVDRERWFQFRSERLRTCMEAWLEAHGLSALPRDQWKVPTPEEVAPQVEVPEETPAGATNKARTERANQAEAQRKRCCELIAALPARELDMAAEFLEFLRERRPTPRAAAKGEPRG